MKIVSTSLTAMTLLILAGCADQHPSTSSDKPTAHGKTLEQILSERGDSEEKTNVKEGIKALLAGDYEKASKDFNVALVNDPTNSWLHTLNAMAYQLLAKNGDVTHLEIAEAGYNQALKFEPSNKFASLQLGRVLKQQKRYDKAQQEFANVLLLEPNNLPALYELASASYYLGDIKTARVAIERYIKGAPNKAEAYRAAGMIMAASGKPSEASDFLKKYETITGNKAQAHLAKRRVDEWKRLYDSGIIMLAQAQDAGAANAPDAQQGAPDAGGDAGAAAPNAAGGKKQIEPQVAAAPQPHQMVAIDAIVMRVSEQGQTRKGQNILENFSLTLAPGTHMYARGHGVPIPNNSTSITRDAAGAANTQTTINDPTRIDFQGNPIFPGIQSLGTTISGGGAPLSVSRLFTQGISFGSVTYSLNIANAFNERIKVLDRPSVTTVVGKNAEFFSGAELALGLTGQFGGNVAKTPTGITLKVTPLSLDGERVVLEIEISGSITPPPGDLQRATQSFVPIQTSHVKTTVEMKLGETLMLGGINTQEDDNTKSGTPLLQDIPIIQYFFSQETTDSIRKSVTFLLTPRSHEKNMAHIKAAFNDPNSGELSNLTELEMRNKDWFAPFNSNQAIILKYSAPLYREFRTGDIAPIAWWQAEDFEEQVTQIASFLYY